MKSKKTVINGPVFPVVVPFKNYHNKSQIDYRSLKKYVNYLVDEGAKIIMVASATSRFAQLNIREIKKINEIVVKTVNNQALAIASTPITGSTEEHVQVAQHAENIGAKVVACEYPWRYQGDTALINYYDAILSNTSKIKLMLHVTPGRSEIETQHGKTFRYGIDALIKICSKRRIIGIKEASGDPDHSLKIWKSLSGITSIIVAGRASETFLKSYKYGTSGFFVGTGNIKPKTSLQIYDYATSGKIKKAMELVQSQELPFLNLAKKFGWHASLKTALAEINLMEIDERPPMVPLSKEQRNQLAKVMKDCGWL